MVIIRDKDMKVVSRSNNLRGILDYSRRNTVERVDIWPNPNGAQFGIAWTDGSSCIDDFADAKVCAQFFRHRLETFRWVKIHGVIEGITMEGAEDARL